MEISQKYQEHISNFSCLAHAVEELKLRIIGADLKHPPISTPISIFMAPSSPTPTQQSILQHVEFKNPDKHMTSVFQTSQGPSLKQPPTTPADYFAQTSQHLKVSSKQAISNEISIPEGLNTKERIGELRLMWPLTYATHHRAKYLLQ